MNQSSEEQDHLKELRERLAIHPEIAVDVGGRQLVLRSRHGLFSARSIDEGTELLLRELEALPPPPRVLDLGCGYGAIGLSLAARWADTHVDLVDTDIRAVEATRERTSSATTWTTRL